MFRLVGYRSTAAATSAALSTRLYGGSFSFVSSASPACLCTARRGFVQGGPQPPKHGDKNEMFQVRRSNREEMSERHRKKMEAQERYYAAQVDKPAPLPENAFVKGKFGMRRRLHRSRDGEIDLVKLGQAVDEGVNAMRK